jgi:hypothetical protein
VQALGRLADGIYRLKGYNELNHAALSVSSVKFARNGGLQQGSQRWVGCSMKVIEIIQNNIIYIYILLLEHFFIFPYIGNNNLN